MYSDNKNSFISILYIFDLLSKRHIEKMQKVWHILLCLLYFLSHQTPWKKIFNFLFRKQNFICWQQICQVSWSLDHYLGHNSILKLKFNFRFLKKAIYFRIITFYMPYMPYDAILGSPSGFRPFTKNFLKLQYLDYISVPSNKSLALGGTLPHSGPRLLLPCFAILGNKLA